MELLKKTMAEDDSFLLSEYQRIHRNAYALAGGLGDLAQRASVYFHLYEDSGRRNVFPLIAAHGALWAAGYFAKGLRGGQWLSWQYALQPSVRHTKLRALGQFADCFRDINRRVCAEAYCAYHFAKLYGHTNFAKTVITQPLLDALNACHASALDRVTFTADDRKELFAAFFEWEQKTIVAHAVSAAFEEFDWPAVKALALRPKIEFSFLGQGRHLQFHNFSDQTERIRHGMQAYAIAEQAGLHLVESRLADYGLMPAYFFGNSGGHFSNIAAQLSMS